MNADCVIVDANIAFKCLHTGRGDLRGRIGPGQHPQFFSPRFLFVELFKHKERLASAAKLPETELLEALYALVSRLESKGVFLIPDILCNAGGVTVSYFEWVQDEQHLFWESQDIYNRLERVMKTAFRDVLKIHTGRKAPMRVAANMLGVGRVAEAVQIRGLYP